MVSKNKRPKKPSIADSADRHILYQKSVQSPEFELEFFQDQYKNIRGRLPKSMREDFCGTAHLSVEWCKLGNEHHAIGVDICNDTLNWGREHNIAPAGDDVAKRLTLLNEDVTKVISDKTDFICAMNFSYCVFKTREQLRGYFANARRSLKVDGMLFLDLMGGTETIDIAEDEREIDDEDFTYIWDQAYFNPVDNHIKCKIHFQFQDGSRLDDAFEYDWRLWSLPEIKELLLEAGYSKVRIFWEEFENDPDDADSEYMVGTGSYVEVTEVEQQESWLAYIVAEY